MTTENYTMRVLTPEEGHALYNASLGIVAEGRVYLAATDSPDNWREISMAEAERIKAEQEAAQAADDGQARQAD